MMLLMKSMLPFSVLLVFFQSVYADVCPNGEIAVKDDLVLTQSELNQSLALLSIHQPWEEFFVPIPTVIELLGSVTVFSGKKDFRLDDRPPAGGFKYLRNPQSFRATMTQVSNDCWNSFLVAHRNMDSIQLNMLMIPRRVQTIVKVIKKSPLSMFQSMLRVPLNGIKEIGQLCVKLAQEAETKFKDIYNMLGEVVEVTQNSRGVYDEKLQQEKADLVAADAQKQQLEEDAKLYRKNQEEINSKIAEAEKQYRDALASIPSGWDKIKMELAKIGTRALGAMVDMLPVLTGDVTSLFKRISTTTTGKYLNQSSSGSSGKVPSITAVIDSNLLTEQAKSFIKLLDDTLDGLSGNRTDFNGARFQLNAIIPLIANLKDTPGFSVFNAAVRKAKKIVDRVVSLTSGIQRDEFEKAKESIIDDLDDAKVLVESLLNQPITNNAPTDGDGEQQITGEDPSSQMNAASKWIKFHQQRADANFAKLMKNRQVLGDLMARIARINLETADFDAILELIKESINVLGQLQEQWNMLTQFFTAMAVRTELALNQTINPFLQTVDEGALQQQLTEDGREFLIDIIQPLMKDLQMAAYFLHTVSKTYVEVSSRYVLNQVAGMARLSVLPAAQRDAKLKELNIKAKDAETAIVQMVKEKRVAYGQNVGLLAAAECSAN